ncbi:MAG: hypothetical protein JJU22_15525 [Gammaproteobacteria bacterium]|nr:hypothetical protein [Gammaproteobacteria bacterium]
MQGRHPEDPSQNPTSQEPIRGPVRGPEKQFHPWRLLGAIGAVLLLLVAISALVDVLVLGW